MDARITREVNNAHTGSSQCHPKCLLKNIWRVVYMWKGVVIKNECKLVWFHFHPQKKNKTKQQYGEIFRFSCSPYLIARAEIITPTLPNASAITCINMACMLLFDGPVDRDFSCPLLSMCTQLLPQAEGAILSWKGQSLPSTVSP